MLVSICHVSHHTRHVSESGGEKRTTSGRRWGRLAYIGSSRQAWYAIRYAAARIVSLRYSEYSSHAAAVLRRGRCSCAPGRRSQKRSYAGGTPQRRLRLSHTARRSCQNSGSVQRIVQPSIRYIGPRTHNNTETNRRAWRRSESTGWQSAR